MVLQARADCQNMPVVAGLGCLLGLQIAGKAEEQGEEDRDAGYHWYVSSIKGGFRRCGVVRVVLLIFCVF